MLRRALCAGSLKETVGSACTGLHDVRIRIRQIGCEPAQLPPELCVPVRVCGLALKQRIDLPLDLSDRSLRALERAARRRELLTLLLDECRRQQLRITCQKLQRLRVAAAAGKLCGLLADSTLRQLLRARQHGAVW